MMLPEWLVWWALPPAERYLRRRSPMAPMVPTSGELQRGSASYVPLTERPLTEDELARWQAENPMPEPDEEELERGWREQDAAVERWSPRARACAEQVVRTGQGSVDDVPGVVLEARLVRFRWGSSVVEVDARALDGPAQSSSASVVGRDAGPEVVDEVALQVAGALAQVAT
ncbi:hypothetical protein ACF3NS_12540 [Arsenicicoccus cauae]|uniref:hypothetical protein n=1 Tax=Arsenicicoccus cauae TaxID=2663847 RepID=UPI00370D24FA